MNFVFASSWCDLDSRTHGAAVHHLAQNLDDREDVSTSPSPCLPPAHPPPTPTVHRVGRSLLIMKRLCVFLKKISRLGMLAMPVILALSRGADDPSERQKGQKFKAIFLGYTAGGGGAESCGPSFSYGHELSVSLYVCIYLFLSNQGSTVGGDSRGLPHPPCHSPICIPGVRSLGILPRGS